MEERKWEELDMDCLVNVLGRLGMESLLFDVPFVCKSWYKATLNPLCWQHLDFPEISHSFKSRLVDQYRSEGFKATELIQFAVNRSGGYAVSLVVPMYFTDEAFICLAEGWPALKCLTLPFLPYFEDESGLFFSRFISKWKNLEKLRLGSSMDIEPILTQVSLHCKNFVDLGISRGFIEEDESLLIVTLLSNIKYLDLRQLYLDQEALVRILKGCKKLVHFDIRDSEDFEGDNEILMLSSHIPSFMYDHDIACVHSDVMDESDITMVEEGSYDHDIACVHSGVMVMDESDITTMVELFGVPCNVRAGGNAKVIKWAISAILVLTVHIYNMVC